MKYIGRSSSKKCVCGDAEDVFFVIFCNSIYNRILLLMLHPFQDFCRQRLNSTVPRNRREPPHCTKVVDATPGQQCGLRVYPNPATPASEKGREEGVGVFWCFRSVICVSCVFGLSRVAHFGLRWVLSKF